MKEVVIIGAGIHKFGRFDNKSYLDLGQEAARMALDILPLQMGILQGHAGGFLS